MKQTKTYNKWERPPEMKMMVRPELPAINRYKLDNQLPIFELRAGIQPVLKIEILFRAGRPFEHKKQVARFTNHLMREGTIQMPGNDIAEAIDFLGSTLIISESMDYGGFVLYCLKKHIKKTLPILIDILIRPSFELDDLRKFKKNAKEKLIHDLGKNDFLAYREITDLVFGGDSSYGYNSNSSIIDAIEREDLIKHYESTYTASNAFAMISGKTDKKTMDYIMSELEKIPQGMKVDSLYRNGLCAQPGLYKVASKKSHQSAVRLGKRAVLKQHEDFNGLYILNTILGGYFGSRLMHSLREESGYTYNVYSSLDTMLYDSAMLISMETDPAYVDQSIAQVNDELSALRNELVSEEELIMVKSYLSGYFLTALDGPLNASELVKSLLMDELDENSFERLIDLVINISKEEIQSFAQRYLSPESFITLVVEAQK